MANIKTNDSIKMSQKELLSKLQFQNIIEVVNEELFLTKIGQIILDEESGIKSDNGMNNAYLAAKREWDVRYGGSIAQTEKCHKRMYISYGIAALAIIVSFYFAFRSKVEPIFFAVDQIGRIIATGNPTNKIKVNQLMMQQQLSNYIIALRSFSSDPDVNNHNYDLLKAMTAQNMASEVDDIIRKNAGDPNIITITIDITSFNVLPNSTSYQIEWTENRKMSDGNNSQSYYRAVISVNNFTPNDPNVYYLNPLGLLITRLDISRLKAAS